jgi:HEAT repeat protein
MQILERFQKKPDIRMMTERKDIPGLLRLLGSTQNGVQAAAVRALGTIGPEATPYLIAALRKKNRTLRLGVIGALAEGRDVRALPALVGQTKDEYSEIRWQGAIALGELGDALATPALLDCLRDKDKYVRYASAISLLKIGYQPVIDDDWAWYFAGMQQWEKLVPLGKPSLPA